MLNMSSQNGIRSVLNDSDALWIASSKDQFLPAYFMKLVRDYAEGSNPNMMDQSRSLFYMYFIYMVVKIHSSEK